jgi:putative transposase
VRYLHLNPARIRTPLNPWTYRWSSHAAYVGRPSLVQVSIAAVLASFHRQVGPARQAYRKFMLDGLAHGHQDRFYETVDQRFLSDERFIEDADRRTAATREVSIRPPRVAFGTLLTAVAQAYTLLPRAILAPGRQGALVPARAMLVYLAREWSHLTTRELAQRVQRDTKVEALVRHALVLPHAKLVTSHADPFLVSLTWIYHSPSAFRRGGW